MADDGKRQSAYERTAERERTLLGTWLRGEYQEHAKIFDKADFAEEKLFSCVAHGMTITENLREIQKYTNNNPAYLAELAFETFAWAYPQMLKEHSYRPLERATKKLAEDGDWQSYWKTVGQIQNAVDSVGGQIKAWTDFEGGLEKLLADRRDERCIRYRGLPTLNRLTGGIHRKELTAVAGRPGTGKSAFALQVACEAESDGEKVLFFPLEMSGAENFGRIYQRARLCTAQEWKTGRIPEASVKLMDELRKEIVGRGNLLQFEGVNRLPDIEALIERHHPHLVVIDQLAQVRVPGQRFDGRQKQYQYVTTRLKEIAMQEDIAILLLCQLNRGAQEQEPSLANLKDSGSIEEDSDNVILLHPVSHDALVSAYKQRDIFAETDRPVLVKLAKQRNGETRNFFAAFVPNELRFYEVDPNGEPTVPIERQEKLPEPKYEGFTRMTDEEWDNPKWETMSKIGDEIPF